MAHHRFRSRSSPPVARLTSAALVAFVTFASWPRLARADGPEVVLTPTDTVTHTLPDGEDFTRPASLQPAGISFEDCERSISINFPLTVDGAEPGTDRLTAYAGANCELLTSRTGAAATCWPVLAGDIAFTTGKSVTASLPVRQILAHLYDAPGPFGSAATAVDETICHAQRTSAGSAVGLFFLLTDSSGETLEADAHATVTADLAAAIAPPGLLVKIGDGLLYPSWTTVVDRDVAGFNIYYLPIASTVPVHEVTVCPDGGEADAGVCETYIDPTPPANVGDGGDGGALLFAPDGFACASPFLPQDSDAGVLGAVSEASDAGDQGDDSGADAGSSVTSTAASTGPLALQPHEFDPSLFHVFAVNGDTSAVTLPGLTDFQGYAVAVAAVDALGNVGALTSASGSAVCQYPLPTTDFWRSYVDDGGGSGGGCSLSGDAVPGTAGAACLVTGLVVASGRKRRRCSRVVAERGRGAVSGGRAEE